MPEPVSPEAPKPFFDHAPDEPTGTTPATPPSAPVAIQPPVKHSIRSLRLAAEFGFTKEEVESYTPAELDQAVYVAQMTFNRMQRDNAIRMERMQAQDPRATPPASPPPPPEDDLGFDTSNFDEGLVAFLKAQKKENAELKKSLAARDERDSQRETLSRRELLDASFDELGDLFAHVVGVGGGSEIAPEEMARRVAIINAAQIDTDKDSPRAVKAKIKKAADLLYGAVVRTATPAPSADPYAVAQGLPSSVPVAPVRPAQPSAPPPAPGLVGNERVVMERGGKLALADPVTNKITRWVTREEWEAAALAQPTHRAGAKEAHGVERATRSVEQILRERGVVDDGGSGHAQRGDFLGQLNGSN